MSQGREAEDQLLLTSVVKNNCQHRDAVACCDPIYTSGNAKQKRPITNNLADEFGMPTRIESKFHAESSFTTLA